MATGRIPINGTAAIQQTIVDAKGDLIVATGADAVARLAVGTNGHTLVADSSTATGLAFAAPAAGGGMTLLSTTPITAVSSISITAIDQTYNELVIVVSNAATATSGNAALQFNSDTTSNYTWGFYDLIANTQAGNASTSEIRWLNGATTTANVNNIMSIIRITRYADTTPNKLVQIASTYIGSDASARKGLTIVASYRGTSGISSIQFLSVGGGNYTAQGNIFIYGVK